MSKTPIPGKSSGPGLKKPLNHERRVKRRETFGAYLRQFLRDYHEGYGLTSGSRRVLDDLANDVISRIAAKANRLLSMNGRKTLRVQDVYDAVALEFGNGLSVKCSAESERAIANAQEAKASV